MPHVVNVDDYTSPCSLNDGASDQDWKRGKGKKRKERKKVNRKQERQGAGGKGALQSISLWSGPHRSLNPAVVKGNPELEQQETMPVSCCDFNANSHHLDAN